MVTNKQTKLGPINAARLLWSRSLAALWSHIDFKRCYFHHFLSWNLKLIASDHPRLLVKGVNRITVNLCGRRDHLNRDKVRTQSHSAWHTSSIMSSWISLWFLRANTWTLQSWNQPNHFYSTLTFTCFTFRQEWQFLYEHQVFHLMCVINNSTQWCSCGSVFVWDQGESEMRATLSKRGLKPRPMFELFNTTGNRNKILTGRLWFSAIRW